MKPVIPPKNSNPYRGMFRELRNLNPDIIHMDLGRVRFVFKGMKR